MTQITRVVEDSSWQLLHIDRKPKIHFCSFHYFYGYSNLLRDTGSSISGIRILNAQLSLLECDFVCSAIGSSILDNSKVWFRFPLMYVAVAIIGREKEPWQREGAFERCIVGLHWYQVLCRATRSTDVKLNVCFRRRSFSWCVYERYSCLVGEWLSDVSP